MFQIFANLPLELQRACIESMITTFGICQAVRLRLVCRLFDTEVLAALSTTRALEVDLDNVRTSNGSRQLATTYIIDRVLSRNKHTSNLCGRLRVILTTLGFDFQRATYNYRAALTILASATVFRAEVKDALLLLSDEQPGILRSDTLQRDILGAAALLNKSDFTEEILCHCTANPAPAIERHHVYPHLNGGALHESMIVLASMGGNVDLVGHILRRNLEQNWVQTALYTSIQREHADVVRLLLTPTYTPLFGLSMRACELAAKAGNLEILRMLCDALPTSIGHPRILTSLVESGNERLVRWSILVEAGGHVNERPFDNDPRTPLVEAASFGHSNIVRLLVQMGANPRNYEDSADPLSWAASHGHTGTLKALIAEGFKPNSSRISRSPLVTAARAGQAVTLRTLLELHLDLRFEHAEAAALALEYASGYGFETVVRLLINHGVPIDGMNEDQSPLMNALIGGQPHIVKLLREYGAKEVDIAMGRQRSGYEVEHFPYRHGAFKSVVVK
ncbi:ankyrin [Tothia fuscella]|uniref:Ankyrin n=1 Tax=Tothia fuscella TaxID=1048955 RepID=A0A9P4NRN9_9PEZI|nr:ankyrin [Tothia fuscella]